MAETVGQHSVAAFTSPVNGTSPIDANTVKGNDNTIRSAYVDHDADPGIHVQSSTLASRPVANSAGRKWMTQDSGVIRLFYDDGTSWYEVDYLRTTGGTISGNLSITGTLAVTGVATFTAQPILSSLTASRAVFTDGSKGLVSNAITGTGDVVMSASPTLTGTITAASATLSGTLGVSGLLTFASLKGTGATTVTNILDEDNMASDSATALATQQSIKAYVDAQVGASDALSEVLAIGNTTGANDIIVSAGQKIRTPAVAAQDGSSAITIANTTGALTLATALADSNLATISTAGKVSNSATTATSANTASAIVARDASGNFTAGTITAALTGNASTATTLQTARNINGVSFNGSADITVTAAAGTLTGTTLASNVTASSLTSVGTLANLTVTNPITGSVTGSSGSTTGNAATATALQTARNINGVSFNGTADITVTAAAGTLTGTTLASGVTASSLTSVGTLSSLTVSGTSTSSRLRLSDSTLSGYGGVEFTSLAGFGLGIASTAYSFRAGNGTTEYVNIASNGNLAVDTNTLYVDAANNRVGVGTASPSQPFHLRVDQTADTWARIDNQATGSGGYAGLMLGAFGNTWGIRIGNSATNSNALTWVLDAGGTNSTQMTLTNSGNLGLGVTPSANAATNRRYLSIGGLAVSALQYSATIAETFFNSYFNSSSQYVYQNTGPAGRFDFNAQVSGGFSWSTAPSGTAGNAITFTQAMTLDASGNLLVGETTQAYLSRATFAYSASANNGPISVDTRAYNVTPVGTFHMGGKYNSSGNYRSFAAVSGVKANTTDGNSEGYLAFLVNKNAADPVEVARITSAGCFSVGTTTDLGAGNIAIAAGKYLGYSSTSYMTPENNVSGAEISTAGIFTIKTGSTPAERARITTGGYFKASNTGTYDNATGAYHELKTSSGNWIAFCQNTATSSMLGIGINYTTTANNTGNQFLYCSDNTALRAEMRSNGGLANYQANDVNLSDERVKTDIKPVGSYWDKLKAIEIVTFKYKDQTHDDDNIGVIAQQVEAVAPEFIDVDGFGETPEDGIPLKTVYTTDMYHAAIKALQEAMARIESLEARLAALES